MISDNMLLKSIMPHSKFTNQCPPDYTAPNSSKNYSNIFFHNTIGLIPSFAGASSATPPNLLAVFLEDGECDISSYFKLLMSRSSGDGVRSLADVKEGGYECTGEVRDHISSARALIGIPVAHAGNTVVDNFFLI